MTDRQGRSVKAVAFDLDGTLIDTEQIFAEAARRMLAQRGHELDVAFMATIQGTPGRDSLPRFIERYRLTDSIDAVAADYRRHFIDALGGNLAPLCVGAREAVARVQSLGLPRALTTSSSLEYVRHVFGPLGMLPEFDFVMTAEDVREGKPRPEIYLTAAKRFGVEPADMLVVEDSIAGLRAAKAAGALCVVVPHAHTPLDDIGAADWVVESLASPRLWAIFDAPRA